MTKKIDKLEKQFHIRISENTEKLIEQKANEEKLSKNELVNKAIEEYINKDISDESVYESKFQKISDDLKGLETRYHTFANMFLNFMQLFMYASPEIKEDYTKDKRFHESAKMTNNWFKHMVEDIHEFHSDFFEQIEHVIMVKGEQQ